MTNDMDGGRHTADGRELGTWTGAYALHALSDEEKAEFEAFLVDNDEARGEATELGDTAVMLGLTSTPEQPPAELKSRLMYLIAVTPQLAAEPTAADTAEPVAAVTTSADSIQTSDAVAPTGTTAASEPSTVTPAERKAQARWFTRPVAVLASAAAAIALIVGVSVVGTGVAQQNDQASQISKIVAAADYQRDSAVISTGGTATAVWSEKLGKSAVMFDGLDSAPHGHVYELWYIDAKGTATPAGIFSSDGGTHSAVLEGSMSAGDTIGVTVEPDGGSKKPSGAPIVTVATA